MGEYIVLRSLPATRSAVSISDFVLLLLRRADIRYSNETNYQTVFTMRTTSKFQNLISVASLMFKLTK